MNVILFSMPEKSYTYEKMKYKDLSSNDIFIYLYFISTNIKIALYRLALCMKSTYLYTKYNSLAYKCMNFKYLHSLAKCMNFTYLYSLALFLNFTYLYTVKLNS